MWLGNTSSWGDPTFTPSLFIAKRNDIYILLCSDLWPETVGGPKRYSRPQRSTLCQSNRVSVLWYNDVKGLLYCDTMLWKGYYAVIQCCERVSVLWYNAVKCVVFDEWKVLTGFLSMSGLSWINILSVALMSNSRSLWISFTIDDWLKEWWKGDAENVQKCTP